MSAPTQAPTPRLKTQYREQIPWENLELYWVDERCVPPDHPDSNYRMTREALLDQVPLNENQIFRIRGELEPEGGADRYEADIRKSFRLEGAEMPVFDMVALGMGPDGHTASLFPHDDWYAPTPTCKPQSGQERLL